MVSRSSLLAGLDDDPAHVFSVSLWLSMFVTMTANLSGLNPPFPGTLPSMDPNGNPRGPLALFFRDPDGPANPDG